MRHNFFFLLKVLIIVFASCLYLTGIKWGLPGNELKRFSGVRSQISPEYIKKSWKISKEIQHEKLPRSIFNPIRSFHPDEQNILKSIAGMSPETFDLNPHFFEYPTAQIYLVAVILKCLHSVNFIKLKPDIGFYFDNPEEMARIYLSGRILTVIMAVLGIIIFISIASFFCGKSGSLFAAACLGLSPLYVINSHYMTVDIPMVFWIIVVLYFVVCFIRKGKNYLLFLAAFFTGIAAGTKYPAGILIFLLPFALKTKSFSFYKFSIIMLICFLVFVSGFFITTPYSLLSFYEFKRDILYQAGARGVGANLLSIIYFFPELFFALWVGVFLLIFLFIPGIFFLSKRRNFFDKLILNCIVLAMVPLMVAGGFKYARYYLIVLPFLCLCAGSLFNEFLKIKSRNLRLFFLCLSLFFLTGSISKSIAYSNLMKKPDIRLTSAEYIERTIPKGSKIVFTKDPWIFEVPPVNTERYSVSIISEENLYKVESGSYLILGELQYFLTSGNREKLMKLKIDEIQQKGLTLKYFFENKVRIGLLKFDEGWTIHDMIYTHPKIFVFYKP